MITDPELDEALRRLDPAPTDIDNVRTDATAQKTLRRILDAPTTRYRPRRARYAAIITAAAAIAVGMAVGPELLAGQAPLAWSSSPDNVSPESARNAEQACQRAIANPAGPLTIPALKAVVTEARGSYITVYLTDSAPRRSAMTCYVEDGEVISVAGGVATPQSRPEPAVAANSIVVSLGGAFSDDQKTIREATGRLGSDVVRVVFDTVAKGPVIATVHNGYVVAWWPDKPARPSTSGQSPEPAPEIQGATLTLADGSERYLGVDEIWDAKITP